MRLLTSTRAGSLLGVLISGSVGARCLRRHHVEHVPERRAAIQCIASTPTTPWAPAPADPLRIAILWLAYSALDLRERIANDCAGSPANSAPTAPPPMTSPASSRTPTRNLALERLDACDLAVKLISQDELMTATDVAVRDPYGNRHTRQTPVRHRRSPNRLLPSSYRKNPANVLSAAEYARCSACPPCPPSPLSTSSTRKPGASAGLSPRSRRAGTNSTSATGSSPPAGSSASDDPNLFDPDLDAPQEQRRQPQRRRGRSRSKKYGQAPRRC